MTTESSNTAFKKIVVITGGSQGIGAHLVAEFRARNYGVITIARSIEATQDPDIIAIAGDIADPGISEKALSEGIARFGRIDTLVNNAGIFISKPFTDYTMAEYTSMLDVNVKGFFNITQRLIPQMLKQGSGHIVQVTTSLVDHALSGVPAVLAAITKGGLNAATRSLAIEYAGRGIRVNAVAPGVIKTPMHKTETHAALAVLHPLGRMGEISDIVQGILYLEDAPFVTGEILHIDGGQSAGH